MDEDDYDVLGEDEKLLDGMIDDGEELLDGIEVDEDDNAAFDEDGDEINTGEDDEVVRLLLLGCEDTDADD